MTQTAPAPRPNSPDNALPRVEPPSAGFILQLFVVPAVIVAIIVAIWLMFNWLAHMGDNPETYVRALSRENAARWQAAVNLANALRRPGSKFKSDSHLAAQLSQVLEGELADAKAAGDEADIRARVYLCRALGEFEIADGLPVLLTAARTQRTEAEIPVRSSAIEAIALLASGPAGPKVRGNPAVAATLIDCSREADAALRSRCAFALGVLGGESSLPRLEQMLADPIADVRYNAATGLARHGDALAIDVLTEMLDPAQAQVTESKQDQIAQDYKRPMIQQNALRAAQMLAKANSGADLSGLQAAAKRLSEAKVDPDIRNYARRIAEELGNRAKHKSARASGRLAHHA